MRVFFWTAADDGASWYRADQPAGALSWSGHETWVCSVPVPSLLAKATHIVVSRPARPRALEILAQARERYGCKIIADLDDDYWAMEPSEDPSSAYYAWHTEDDGALLRGLEEGLGLADLVTVASSGELEAVERNASPRAVTVVPNGLHASILGLPRDYENGLSNDGILTIGWAGTASSHDGLELCAKELGRVLRRHTDRVRLRLVGFQPQRLPRDVLKHLEIPGADVAHVEWVPHGDHYLTAVGAFDLWVAPYRDNAFNRAKFATKALEAGFWGIPLVASNIQPYRDWGGDGIALVPEHLPHEWGRQINRLINDATLRRKVGEAARSAAAPYSLQEVGRQWERVLSEL